MISKIKQGSLIGGLLDYLMDEKKGFLVIDSNYISTDKEAAKEDFKEWSKGNKRLNKNILHIPLAFSAKDNVKFNEASSLKNQIIERYIELMTENGHKLTDSQFLAIEHNDTPHPHIHLVFNRVQEGGKSISDKFISKSSMRVCKRIEKEFGLTIASQEKNILHTKEKLFGKDLLKNEIIELINSAKSKHQFLSLDLIKKTLDKNNIKLVIIKDKNDIIFGSYYEKEINGKKIKIKTSALGKDFNLNKILFENELHKLFIEKEINKKIDNNINQIGYTLTNDLTKYAKQESEMMNDLFKLMTLGFFETKVPRYKNVKTNFANSTQIRLSRELKISKLKNEFNISFNNSKNIIELNNNLQNFNSKLIYLEDADQLFYKNEDDYFKFSEISNLTYLGINNHFKNTSDNNINHVINIIEKIENKNILTIYEFQNELEKNGIELIARNKSEPESAVDVIKYSFKYNGLEIKRNLLPKKMNLFISRVTNNQQIDKNKQLNVLFSIINEHLNLSTTQIEFQEKLKESGIESIFKYDSKDNLVGVRFQKDDIDVKGSEIGLSASYIKKIIDNSNNNTLKI